MKERGVGRSFDDAGPEDDERAATWKRLVDRLVEDGEPLATALEIADRIVRRRRRCDTLRTGRPPDPQGPGSD
ncbi:MAG TPA: hypothetical protein VHB21_05520 [Minicystis sp.]|nr:hypothetical protein [Minicystis sp.]